MWDHPQIGYDILKKILFIETAEVVRYHHEKFDGSGYPRAEGEEIPYRPDPRGADAFQAR